MRNASLPTEFADLSGRISYVQRKSDIEYASTCPKCGGSIHPGGEWPDRFILLLQSTATGGPFAFCRVCGYKWLPGRDCGQAVDPKTIALLEQQAREYREKRDAERREKLAKFTTGELWAELHFRMQDEQREYWRNQGITDAWQDYLKLGYMDDKPYMGKDGELHHSPAYTIPYFHTGWKFITMQYRLCNPEDPSDRYRFESRLGTSFFMTTPNVAPTNKVVVCEGAKKAIVARIASPTLAEAVTFYAIPSKVDWRKSGILEAVQGCEKVWIIFDPDCWTAPPKAPNDWQPEPIKFGMSVGKSARIVELPGKLDDLIIQQGMNEDELSNTLNYARRIQ